MAVGKRQRVYSGVRMFTGIYLSSTPRALRVRGAQLEFSSRACVLHGRYKLHSDERALLSVKFITVSILKRSQLQHSAGTRV